MEVDTFLKSPVVIDNVFTNSNSGQRLYESRVQRVVKKASHHSIHVAVY